ncbi:MAG: M23 family metallopeptidase, partial [bacterium]|nr:M23 family metallopeptidase [bacterium]
MNFKIQNLVIVFLCLLTGWIGWSSYNYFFDIEEPQLVLRGLDRGQWCAGDVHCIVGSDKSGSISVWLDGQPLINKFSMQSRDLEHDFVIPTKTIVNGEHNLKVEQVDGSYHKNKTELERSFYVDNTPLQAAFVRSESDFKVFQGRTLHLQFQVSKEVANATACALSSNYNCFPESKNSLVYECFIPITCEEQPNEYLIAVDIKDKVGNTLHLDNKFQIVAYPFKKTALQISQDKMKEEKELGKDSHQFKEELEKIVQNSPKEKLWNGPFCTPIDVLKVTGEFGTIRTAQEKGRYAHKALDITNAPKSVVWASQDGTVALKDRFVYTGNTVVIDHGYGIVSIFCHLDDFAKINVGDTIAKGNPIGYIGKTGYANGYHLHWEM